jgi:leucyl/phenylalanyl-tRNA---protein transferase
MPIFSLTRDYHDLPDVRLAMSTGLIAVSLDIHPQRILAGYQSGMFPWYQDFEGLYHWYSPNPRSVVYPEKLKVHKSMRSIFNQKKFRYTFDHAFLKVIDACRSTVRAYESDSTSSWLNSSFIRSYHALYQQGFGHSIEVWEGDKLVGGLYGVAIGKLFFGESMFSRVPNASKAGFITLVHALQKAGFVLVDCQQDSDHLRTLGSTPIKVEKYLSHLQENRYEPQNPCRWAYNQAEGSLEMLSLPAAGAENELS